MRAIDAWFDYQDQLTKVQAPPQPGSPDADNLHHIPTSKGERSLEQQPEAHQHQGTTKDHVLQSGTQQEDQWVRRTRFSWNQGFLMAHQPQIYRLTPMVRQRSRTPSTNQGPNNTPSALTVVGNPTSTTAQQPAQSFFLQ